MIWAKFCARTRAFAFAIVDRILCPRFELDFCREVDNDLEQPRTANVEKDKKKFILLRWKDDSFAKLVFHTDLLQAQY